MSDMLVKLYDLPDLEPVLKQAREAGIDIRRAIAPEKHVVIEWVRKHFGNGWASECEVAFANQPVSCYLAVKDGQLAGFACYEATCKDFFGPTGVDESLRGLGAGKALLLASLHAMRSLGYGYAVIGGAGPKDFYAKHVGATVIENSTPGIYRGYLKQ
ncbi:hypothetical protein SAMN02799630_01701 [Paenibacillus sp. UNCCL117]|uniref:GNAT family N-acetyltransferase n=1 Tax=unclassified Paenibacillus TaxID=185978 RepID=UPI000888742E|nr:MULTISPECIES: GNAT family N-acetyltransferase [unclassified Paenibacillus]SDC91301.1 hypothetical protein SAMN04488602_104187 [Paenibacillus sp. cl123]SFW29048.1 hypothetical protein SAMN02799630_01701 [Paenibacillus sp. UNCCL117]